MKTKLRVRWNLLDVFLVLLVLLAVLSFYFTFVHPIRFSNLIKREGIKKFAEVEILLPDDLYWMRDVLPVGEESRNVYGELDWKILEMGERVFQGKKIAWLKAKLAIVDEGAGLFRYGKYTLVKGGKILLINDFYFLEGRILDFYFLKEQVPT